MRLPRDISGDRLIRLLSAYGYEAVRQDGSHVQLLSTAGGREHHITIPRHRSIRVGTLGRIVSSVAAYLDRERDELADELFR